MVPQSSPAKRRTAQGPRSRPSAALFAALCLAGVLAAGCSGAKAVTGAANSPSPNLATSTACKKPAAGDLSGAAGTITQADSGAFCLAVGQQMDVFLTAPGSPHAGAVRWTTMMTSDPRVAAPRSSGVLTAPVGVTPGIFQALAPGATVLSSHLPGGKEWRVTIVVR
jgi:hypothetical protein